MKKFFNKLKIEKLEFEFQTEQDNLLKSQEMYIGNLSVEERTIVNKCTEPNEGGRIKFDPVVKLASHEDTFNTGKLFPVKCRKDEYEAIEKSCRGKNAASSSYCYEKSKYYIAVKELIILWDDYQIETAGFIDCSSCDHFIESSVWATESPTDGDNKTNFARVSIAF